MFRRNLKNLTEEDLRTINRGRLGAILVGVLLMNALIFIAPERGEEVYASAGRNASTER